MDGKQPNPPPTTQRWWSRAGAAMRGAMELGGKNHKNRGFFLSLCEAPSPFLVVTELREQVFELERAT